MKAAGLVGSKGGCETAAGHSLSVGLKMLDETQQVDERERSFLFSS
eukprot:COSAG05_NODE_5463_length_1167_cov_57.152449_2_plen_45_part_01